ncbi:inorganic phosphate transporter [Pantoea sp. SM3]|uniref:inorganic phosphate transporter n=1 Tax=Pantoea sp. SM3 TaxID=1628192 RepID=UPI001E6463E3|nr:inorganic phosphate transporter [Pantoea sp. SM3]
MRSGTMVGWRRIVTTLGEKIGKSQFNYAQGISAQMVAMGTNGAADAFGLPFSTTHVLSSWIAGTMVANRSGLQFSTLRLNLLQRVPYEAAEGEQISLPSRIHHKNYARHPVPESMIVPDSY